MELTEYPPLMLIKEAAAYIRVDEQTVIKYGRERRIVIS